MQLTMAARAYMAAKIYSAVEGYFAHWHALQNFERDKWLKDYLAGIFAARSRYEFDLLTMAFLSRLRNGHTSFCDEWIERRHGQPLGFRLARVESQWVVTQSWWDGLAAGDIVTEINGEEIESFIRSKLAYVSASSEYAAEIELFSCPYLFPSSFKLWMLRSRGTHRITIRRGQFRHRPAPNRPRCRRLQPSGVPYVFLPSFASTDAVKTVIRDVKSHLKAKTLMLDVRGNSGGTTPTELIKLLMDRPYRGWRTETPMQIGVAGAYRQASISLPSESLPEYARGFLDAGSAFAQSSLITQPETEEPEGEVFRGRLVILADERCVSACEDFLAPFKDNKRATIVGRQTMGTSGQPYYFHFANGMSFRVSAKRLSFPDGTPFEGVGVAPDVSVPLRMDDTRRGVDKALEVAVQVAVA